MAERVRALSRWPHTDPCIGLPIEVVLDGPKGNVVGFVMPRFQGALLLSAFNQVAANIQGVSLKPLDRITIAQSLAKRFEALHTGRLLVPDANEANFLVEQIKALWEVYAIDCDSFEFEARDSRGQLRRFLTDVGKEEFLAPELQAQSNHGGKHTIQTDLFSLAILIWLLLKGGAHPFSIKALGNVRVPPLSELIQEGHWPYSPVKPIPPEWGSVDAGIPWAVLPKEIRELFIRAFRDGHTDPLKRPHAGGVLRGLPRFQLIYRMFSAERQPFFPLRGPS
jgi:DNA-binding helix-hairpin-helix protein with protein kinase domain